MTGVPALDDRDAGARVNLVRHTAELVETELRHPPALNRPVRGAKRCPEGCG